MTEFYCGTTCSSRGYQASNFTLFNVQFTVNAFVLNNEPHAPQSLHCYPSHCSCLRITISPSYRIKILEATQAIVHKVPESDRRLSRLSWREGYSPTLSIKGQ
jgi:hypothetical protein